MNMSKGIDYEHVEYEYLDTDKMIQELMRRHTYAAFVGVNPGRVMGEQKCFPCFYHTEPANFGLIGAVDTLKSIIRMKALHLIKPLGDNPGGDQ